MVIYDEALEDILRKHCEQCESLYILHRYCHQYFNAISNASNVCVILLSGSVGFCQALNIDFKYTNLILGLISLIIGLIKSIETFFNTSRRSSEHKLIFLAYLRVHKKLLTELALHREDRQPPEELIAVIKDQISSLEESAPIILKRAITKFQQKYGEPSEISLPPILNGLTKVEVNRPLNISASFVQIDDIH